MTILSLQHASAIRSWAFSICVAAMLSMAATADASAPGVQTHFVKGISPSEWTLQPNSPQEKSQFGITILPNQALAANTQMLAGVERAVQQWEAVLHDSVHLTIVANLAPLGTNEFLATAENRTFDLSYNILTQLMKTEAGPDEAILASLPTLEAFAAHVTTHDAYPFANSVQATKANLKALGLDVSFDDPNPDHTITINSDRLAEFDLSRADGITAGLVDFEAVVAHELGHALGFFSEVQTIASADRQDVTGIFTVPSLLDLFRFRPGEGADFGNASRILTWQGDGEPNQVFYDGVSEVALSADELLDGKRMQASHWRDVTLTNQQMLGLMVPRLLAGIEINITQADVRALGVIGWNTEPTNSNVVPVSGTIVTDTTWHAENVYRIDGDVTINLGTTLTIEPGTVVKFTYQSSQHTKRRIVANGKIIATGTADLPVVFTSSRDDAYAGDTNDDGPDTLPAPADWGYIQLVGSGSRLDHCIFRYGGYRDDNASDYNVLWHNYLLWIRHSNTEITNSHFDYAHAMYIQADGVSSPTIMNNEIGLHSSSGGYGLFCDGTSPMVSGNSFANHSGFGIYCTGQSASVLGNTLTNIGGRAIQCDGASATVSLNHVTRANTGICAAGGTGSIQGNVIGQATYGILIYGGNRNCTLNSISNSSYAMGLFNDTKIDLAANTFTNIYYPAVLVGSTMSSSRTWRPLINDWAYLVWEDLIIDAGDTLNIEPGTIVKFRHMTSQHDKRRIIANGTLLARGSQAEPIVFTSSRDDSLGGDTNRDGIDTRAVSGDWGYIQLTGSGSRLEQCRIRYGGYKDDNLSDYQDLWHNFMLWIAHLNTHVIDCRIDFAYDYYIYADSGSSPVISGNHISEYATAGAHGLYCDGASPVISNNTFSDHSSYGIYCTGTAPVITGNHLVNSGDFGIRCDGPGATITGNVVSTATTGVRCASGTATVRNNAVSLTTYGMLYYGGRPTVTGNYVNNSTYPIGLFHDTQLDLAANSFTNIHYPAVLVGNTMSSSRTWRPLINDWAYLVWEDLIIDAGDTLTVEPGTIVKFRHMTSQHDKRRIVANGALLARGSQAHPIVFTSSRDDSLGGDTNRDGLDTRAASGDWGYIQLAGSGSRIDRCSIRYGGYKDDNLSDYQESWHNYMLWITHNNATVNNSRLAHSYANAVYCENASPDLIGNVIIAATRGIYVFHDAAAFDQTAIRDNVILVTAGSDDGIYCSGDMAFSEFSITGNLIVGPAAGDGVDIRNVRQSSTFTGNDLSGHTNGLVLTGASPLVGGNVFHQTGTMRGTGRAIEIGSGVTTTITANTITGYAYGIRALRATGSIRQDLNIVENHIIENPGYGIYLASSLPATLDGPAAVITDNDITGNGTYGLFTGPYLATANTGITAIANWWGTEDLQQIESMVFHDADDSTSPLVTFDPPRTGPIGASTAVAWAAPRQMNVQLLPGTGATRQLVLGNSGLSDLDFSILEATSLDDGAGKDTQTDVTWLACAPTQGVIPPGGNIAVSVNFTACNQPDGDYLAALVVASSDPTAPLAAVPVSMAIGHVIVSGIAAGTTVTVDSNVVIAWTAHRPGDVASYDILLSRNGGIDFSEIIVAGISGSQEYQWTASGVAAERCQMRVIARYLSGEVYAGETEGVFAITNPASGSEHTDEIPQVTRILQASPNPFNPRTSVTYAIARAGWVRMEVIDARGCVILRQEVGAQATGLFTWDWHGSDEHSAPVSSGVYFCRLLVDGVPRGATKMTLVR